MIHQRRRRLPAPARVLLAALVAAAMIAAAPTSPPTTAPATTSAGDFTTDVDLAALGRVAVFDDGRLNSFESFARKMMRYVSGPRMVNDQPPVFTYLDLALRPQAYVDQPIIFVKKKPVRAQIIAALERSGVANQPGFDDDMARFLDEGLIAAPYIESAPVRTLLGRLRQDVLRTAKFVDQIDSALTVRDGRVLLGSWRVVPPPGDDPQQPWLSFDAIMMGDPAAAGFSAEQRARIVEPWQALIGAWMQEDAAGVNDAATQLAVALPQVNPELYPASSRAGWPWTFDESSAWGWASTAFVLALLIVWLAVTIIRGAAASAWTAGTLLVMLLGLVVGALWLGGQDPLVLETFYFRSYNLTWIWVFYALSLAPLLLSIVFRWSAARWVGLALFVLAFAGHSAATLLRWYVADRWPNSNMFEAVTTAAWFGGVCAVALEPLAGRSMMRGLFALGSAVSSMVALMCAYYMPVELDAGISNRMPVLHDVWLYIHTNVIIFSYCLIFMAAVSALLYLGYRLLRPDSDAPGRDEFARVGGAGSFIAVTPQGAPVMQSGRSTLGQVLDGTTMVLMELSFIMLWAGLVMGAIWADHSWGRPWGWDPKEVFALNTFLVFAVLVHVRMKTRDKGLWTALIALVGAAVMLFNWIAINFVITGLHSYA
ncbi:MAG: cytochrome c biogenesis protein CcsA [Planctomycetota bacterium]|jgi:cytochrome c-type biogenesis protein CcsB